MEQISNIVPNMDLIIEAVREHDELKFLFAYNRELAAGKDVKSLQDEIKKKLKAKKRSKNAKRGKKS